MAAWTLVWGYLKRFGAWLVHNPVAAAIGAAVLFVLSLVTRLWFASRRLTKLEAGAQKARVDASLEPGRVETAVIEDRLAAEEKRATGAHGRADDAAARQTAIEAESHARAKRWPTRLPLIMLALLAGGGAWAGECLPDADMTGLLDAMTATAATLTGLDKLAVEDGVAEIRTRIAARKELCTRLDEAAIEQRACLATVAHKERLLEIARGNVQTIRAEWEAVLQKPRSSGRAPFGWTVGLCASLPLTDVQPGDDLILSASGCWGWRP